MGYFRDNVERTEGYTPGFQPQAADVVKLNTNENPYPPSPQVMNVLAAIRPEQLQDTRILGTVTYFSSPQIGNCPHHSSMTVPIFPQFASSFPMLRWSSLPLRISLST
jgi:hypothetical protein